MWSDFVKNDAYKVNHTKKPNEFFLFCIFFSIIFS